MAGEAAQTAKTLVDHLPVLQVVVPMLASPLCMLFARAGLAWAIAFAASLACLAISIALLATVVDGGVISYHLGGWEPPWGIEYRIDTANAFVLVIVSAIAALVLPYARQSIAAEIEAKHHALFYTCLLLCICGLLGVTATGDAFNVFVFLEISSLSTYALVALGAARDKRALTAAYNYLIMGTIGATFFVIGIGFLYMATGTLNMADLAERIAQLESNRTVRAAFAFIVVGIGMKLAIYPLHMWLPNAYTFAPSAVTAFLAATSTKVAIYVLLRFSFSVFSPGFEFERFTLLYVVLPFAVMAMFLASIAAVFQQDIKRLLAYSSIAQIGYMLLGIGLVTATGLAGSIIHLFNHAITKGALFMAVGAIVMQTGHTAIPKLAGLGRAMPLTGAAIVTGGLSLIGIPGTAGFISKWVLVSAALEKGWWPVALLIVASSLLAVVYVWKIVEIMYLKPAPQTSVGEAPLGLLLPTWGLAAACVFFGLWADLTIDAATDAANGLFGGGFAAR